MSKSILQRKRILTKASSGSSLSTPVSIANGGTGISSYAIGDIIYASGTTTLSKLAIGTANQQLRVNAGATALEYFTPASSGITVGTTTITSGTNTRIPFNDSGVYGEDADFTWDKTNNILNIGSTTAGTSATNSGINIGGVKALRQIYDNSNIFLGQIYSTTGSGNIFMDSYRFYSVGAINKNNSVIIGSRMAEQGTGNQSIAIGGFSCAASNYSICIGYGNYYGAGSIYGHRVIAIGAEISNEANATAQGFLGGSTVNGYISDWFFNGRTSTAVYSTTLNACGGSGTNNAGASLTIAGGKSTGSAAGGSLLFKTSTTLGSGATAQTLVTRLTLSGGAVTTDASTATWADALDHVLGTTTGSKWGTSTSQKQSFWNATPIVQPTTAYAAATLVGGAGTNITDTDTFDGYTLKQIVAALRGIGLLA